MKSIKYGQHEKSHSLTVNLKQLGMMLLIAFFFLIVISLKPYISGLTLESQISAIAVLGIIETCVIIISAYNAVKRLDCYMIFMILVFFFMFGQHVLILFGLQPSDITLLSGRVSDEAILETGYLVLYSIGLMHMGYTVTIRSRSQAVTIPGYDEDVKSRVKFMRVAECVAIAVSIPSLYTLIRNAYLTLVVGYGSRMLESQYQRSGILNIASILESFMVPALLAMFICKKPDQKWPTVLLLIYIVLYLLSGSRIRAFILICAVIYIEITIHKAPNFKKVVSFIILGLVVVFIFSIISGVRGSVSDINSIGDVYSYVKTHNLIVDSMSESGYTFSATATVVDNCPNPIGFLYGRSYLSGIIYILPNGLTGNYYASVPGVDEAFHGFLSYYAGIGSSFIAEAYYNFGYASYVIEFIYGVLLGKLCYGIENNINKRDFKKTFLFLGIFAIICFYVRSDTRTFFRNFVWFYLPLYLMASVKIKGKRR